MTIDYSFWGECYAVTTLLGGCVGEVPHVDAEGKTKPDGDRLWHRVTSNLMGGNVVGGVGSVNTTACGRVYASSVLAERPDGIADCPGCW